MTGPCRFTQDAKATAKGLPRTEDLPRWATVGPAQYHVEEKNSCIGAQLLSDRTYPGAASIGKDARFPGRKADWTPGPGLYRV